MICSHVLHEPTLRRTFFGLTIMKKRGLYVVIFDLGSIAKHSQNDNYLSFSSMPNLVGVVTLRTVGGGCRFAL